MGTMEVGMACLIGRMTITLVILCCFSSVAVAQLQGKKPCEETPLANAKAVLYSPGVAKTEAGPIALAPGPHLFVDDYYIASSKNVKRDVNVPQRDPAVPNPIVTGKEDG
jgi:hypothetical protein